MGINALVVAVETVRQIILVSSRENDAFRGSVLNTKLYF